DVGHVVLGERRAEDLPQAGVATGTAAQGYLVELRALLIHAENADMAHVMVAAGVHAAGDIQVQLAQVEQVVQIIEAALDGLGHRDRSEEHTSELQSREKLVCRLLLEKKR